LPADVGDDHAITEVHLVTRQQDAVALAPSAGRKIVAQACEPVAPAAHARERGYSAELEGADGAVSFASGMAAINAIFCKLLEQSRKSS
jgi:cystathionine beta-lyase/cystathionine gamma-synthase